MGLRVSEKIDGESLRLVRDLASGRVKELAILCHTNLSKDGESVVHAELVAVYQTELPNDAPVWINDATATLRTIELLSGRKVFDKTPAGIVEQIHSITQHPTDVIGRRPIHAGWDREVPLSQKFGNVLTIKQADVR